MNSKLSEAPKENPEQILFAGLWIISLNETADGCEDLWEKNTRDGRVNYNC